MIAALSKTLLRAEQLDEADAEFVSAYFRQEVRSELVPMLLGRKVKMPQLVDGDGYRGAVDFEAEKEKLAVIHIPRHLDRFLTLPERRAGIESCFWKVSSACPSRDFQVVQVSVEAFALKATRDADLDMDDDVSRSAMNRVERGLKKRKQGEYVGIIHDRDMPQDMLQGLVKNEGSRRSQYRGWGPVPQPSRLDGLSGFWTARFGLSVSTCLTHPRQVRQV